MGTNCLIDSLAIVKYYNLRFLVIKITIDKHPLKILVFDEVMKIIVSTTFML